MTNDSSPPGVRRGGAASTGPRLPETSAGHPLAPSSYPRRFGSYELLGTLGRGGMGDVCLARKRGPMGIEQLCVLKQIRNDKTGKQDYARRFVDEARIMAQLNHANICHVLEVGCVGDTWFLALEHIHGMTLTTLVERHHDPLPRDVALLFVSEVLEGLDYAHRHKDPLSGTPLPVVHRDISPHNVMVNFEGEVKLIDFGLASSELKGEHTESDVVMGKVAYMSPEQARGDPVDGRTDQYAAAIMAVELLLHERFYGERPSHAVWGLSSQGTFRPERFAEIEAPVRAVLDRALAPRHDERYPDCRSMKAALLDAAFQGVAQADARVILRDFMQGSFRAEMERSFQLVKDALSAAGAALPPPDGIVPPVDEHTAFTQRSMSFSLERRRKMGLLIGLAAASSLGFLALFAFVIGDGREAEPAVATAAAVPLVELRFVTDPPGAKIYKSDDEENTLGATPLTLSLPHSAEPLTFYARLEGYEPKELRISADQNRELVASLVKLPLAPPPTATATTATTRETPPPTKGGASKTKPGQTKKPAGKAAKDKNAIVDPW